MIIILTFIFSIILTFIIPIAIIYFLVRYFTRGKGPNGRSSKPPSGLREVFLFSIICAATFAGLASIFLLPVAFLGVEDFAGSGTALAVYLIASMAFLMLGMIFKDIVGRFLMVMGIIILVFSVLPYVANFRSTGGFLLVLGVFILLVFLIVRASRKEHNG